MLIWCVAVSSLCKKKIADCPFRTDRPQLPPALLPQQHICKEKKTGSFSLIERVILSAGAMLIFSVYFHLTKCPEGHLEIPKLDSYTTQRQYLTARRSHTLHQVDNSSWVTVNKTKARSQQKKRAHYLQVSMTLQPWNLVVFEREKGKEVKECGASEGCAGRVLRFCPKCPFGHPIHLQDEPHDDDDDTIENFANLTASK